MKKDLSKLREKVIKSNFIARAGISNGNALCTTQDGAGRNHLEYAFAGGITPQPTTHSDTNEFIPDPSWSNGSDTRAIEAKLRATKKKTGYVEVTGHGGKRTGAGRKQLLNMLYGRTPK